MEQPIQNEIEDKVDVEKEITNVPEQTRSARILGNSVKSLSKIANGLFNKETDLNEQQKDYVAKKLNVIGNKLQKLSNEDIQKISCDLRDVQASDIEDETQVVAKKIANCTRKLIIIGERKMADNEFDEVTSAQEKKLAIAQRLVKLAGVLKGKKQQLTASQKESLSKRIIAMAQEIQAADEEQEDQDEVTKSDMMKSFSKSRRYNDKRLNNCVDWKLLNTKGTTKTIGPTTKLYEITLEDLKKIQMSLKGIK